MVIEALMVPGQIEHIVWLVGQCAVLYNCIFHCLSVEIQEHILGGLQHNFKGLRGSSGIKT